MYTNIPKSDVINIINNTLKTVTERNYFQFDHQNYRQTEGLAMGAPTAAVLAEIYGT
jgi:hypothetical protein